MARCPELVGLFPGIDWKIQFPNIDKLRGKALALLQLTEYESRGMSAHSPFARGSQDDRYEKRTSFIPGYRVKCHDCLGIFPSETNVFPSGNFVLSSRLVGPQYEAGFQVRDIEGHQEHRRTCE